MSVGVCVFGCVCVEGGAGALFYLIILKLHGLMKSKYFKTKAIT